MRSQSSDDDPGSPPSTPLVHVSVIRVLSCRVA